MKTRIKRYFITGIVVILPVFITVYTLAFTIRFLDGLLGKYINPYFQQYFGTSFFGIGLIAITVLIFLTGVMATSVFVKRIMPYFENVFLRIPLVYQIYPAVKQLVKFLFSDETLSFKKVVLIEFPYKGIYTIAFVTNEFSNQQLGDQTMDTVCVYISSTPNPITGFFVILPRRDVTFVDMSVDEAIKIIISGGVLMREDIMRKKQEQSTPRDSA
jgi:uncharacterized membrane protein